MLVISSIKDDDCMMSSREQRKIKWLEEFEVLAPKVLKRKISEQRHKKLQEQLETLHQQILLFPACPANYSNILEGFRRLNAEIQAPRMLQIPRNINAQIPEKKPTERSASLTSPIDEPSRAKQRGRKCFGWFWCSDTGVEDKQETRPILGRSNKR